MKFRLIIDSGHEEEVVVYAREKTQLALRIEELVSESAEELIGYSDKAIVKLSAEEIFAFSVENGKVFAITEGERLWVQKRLYQIEEAVGARFVKINQSCIINTDRIDRFETTIGASLMVVMKNGYRDYVSRRQMKIVKERLGLKK